MNKIILALALSAISNIAMATETAAEINKLYVNKGGLVLFSLVTPITNKPACNTNGAWNFSFSLKEDHGKEMYSTLLAAYLSSTRIIVGYGDLCTAEFPATAVSYVYFSG